MNVDFRIARRMIIIGVVLPAWVAFSSCHRDLPGHGASTGDTAKNFSAIFEDYCNGMNVNYVVWAIDTTDWDRVYRTYKPLFANLHRYDSSDVLLSLQYFR